MRSFVILLLIGAAVAASFKSCHLKSKLKEELNKPEGNIRNAAIENLIREALEDFRGTMLNGSDSIPVLDPLEISEIFLDGASINFPGVNISLNKLKVSNLSTFVLNHLAVNLSGLLTQRIVVNLDVSIPEIVAEAEHYKLFANAMGANIFGDGKAKVKLVEPRLSGTVVVTLTVLNFNITIESADLKLGLKEFEPEIEGLFGDAGTSQYVNAFLKNLLPQLVVTYENQISEVINRAVIQYGNQLVNGLF